MILYSWKKKKYNLKVKKKQFFFCMQLTLCFLIPICVQLALYGDECQSLINVTLIIGKLKGASSMSFTPLHDRVVVRRLESEEKTAGGLIIPDSAKEKPAEGEIVSVGAGAKDETGKRISMDLKAGDKVLFGKWSGTEVKISDEELLIMKESDILGILS